MRAFMDANTSAYVATFELDDWQRSLRDRFSLEEFERHVHPRRVIVPAERARNALYGSPSATRAVGDALADAIDAAERHAMCYRPGGYDANGAPV